MTLPELKRLARKFRDHADRPQVLAVLEDDARADHAGDPDLAVFLDRVRLAVGADGVRAYCDEVLARVDWPVGGGA